jgi:hypothetical protein
MNCISPWPRWGLLNRLSVLPLLQLCLFRLTSESPAQAKQTKDTTPIPILKSDAAMVTDGMPVEMIFKDGEAAQIQKAGQRSQALTQPEDVPPVSPLCIRVQGADITEALLFHVDLLESAMREGVIIKDHKSFLKVHPNTFRGQAAIEWLRGHAARALFGSEAEKEKNQQLSRSVALLLGQKLLVVGVFRQVTGSLTKPLEDPNALFRFHEEGPILNCRSIWFQNAREPLLVVSELLYTMLNLRLSLSQRGQDLLKDSEELNNFTASAAELQLVNINDLSRIQLLAFFLNAYNLMVLHAHVVRGSTDNRDFKLQKIPFTRDNQYMIAAYNWSLAEIEERLFCRVLRAKAPKKSDKSRAPEPRLHFALSLGCASSPRIRIYQPETLEEDLQQAAIEYLQTNCPKNQVRMQKAAAVAAVGKKIHEVVLPKLFKWYKGDFGFSKQEILVSPNYTVCAYANMYIHKSLTSLCVYVNQYIHIYISKQEILVSPACTLCVCVFIYVCMYVCTYSSKQEMLVSPAYTVCACVYYV